VFYTANNSKLQVNGNEILASNAEISLQANLQPNYNIKQRHTESFTATNGIGGTLSFNYYLTGVPAIANASISFFDQLNGQFVPTTEQAPTDKEVLNFRHASVAHYIPIENTTLSGSVEDFVAGTYNYQSEVQPVYLMGETKPSAVSFGPKNVNMNFETDNPTGYLPVSGNTARISVDLKNTANTVVESFTCSGVMRGRNLASSVGDYIKQTINVTQASTQDTSVYVGAIIDSYGGEGCVGIGTIGGNI